MTHEMPHQPTQTELREAMERGRKLRAQAFRHMLRSILMPFSGDTPQAAPLAARPAH